MKPYQITDLALKSGNRTLVEKITLENFTFQTFTCKSDNRSSIEHITLVARESDIWRSVENITLEIFRFHELLHVKVILYFGM